MRPRRWAFLSYRSLPLSMKFSGEVRASRSSRRRSGMYVRVSMHAPTYEIW